MQSEHGRARQVQHPLTRRMVLGAAAVTGAAESLGNPYGPNGRAALALMKLSPA